MKRELASVMAHEISHVTQRHGARMIEAASKINIPTIAALVGSHSFGGRKSSSGLCGNYGHAKAAVQYQSTSLERMSVRQMPWVSIYCQNRALTLMGCQTSLVG